MEKQLTLMVNWGPGLGLQKKKDLTLAKNKKDGTH